MNIYDDLNVKRYINAHDTYTVYGGSRMSRGTLAAMNTASEWFMDIAELQKKLGGYIASITQNEDAYITNGAAGGLLLAAAACMTKGDLYRYRKLPDTRGIPNEIIVMRCQRNAYDAALSAAGAVVVEIGDADETPEYELEGAINDKTAAIFYFESSLFRRGSMPLEKLISIAKNRGVPVVVDAAAQLPPVSNLWNFTRMGADMAIFSGGKTLCGPQASGLIVGKPEWMDICRKIGSPVHGICRSSKAGREEMAGLCNALSEYLAKDHGAESKRLEDIVSRLIASMEKTGAFKTKRLGNGPVGQTYPRAWGEITGDFGAKALADMLRERNPGIYIGICPFSKNAIYLSPLNLRDDEVDIVISALEEAVGKLTQSEILA